jgi:cold shock protein
VGLSRAFSGVQPDDGSEDVFVHISAVEQSALAQVVEGQKVQFDLEHGRQGKLAAAKVRAG